MKKLMNRFLDYVVKDRRTPDKNRERVGQNLMILAVFLFFVFIINFAIIVGTDTKFGHNLSSEASDVYQQTVTVQAKRGTIYDRNGVALAEDSTTYSVYAIISKSYVSSITKLLDDEVIAFQNRSIEKKIPYMMTDVLYIKVREDHRVKSKAGLSTFIRTIKLRSTL